MPLFITRGQNARGGKNSDYKVLQMQGRLTQQLNASAVFRRQFFQQQLKGFRLIGSHYGTVEKIAHYAYGLRICHFNSPCFFLRPPQPVEPQRTYKRRLPEVIPGIYAALNYGR